MKCPGLHCPGCGDGGLPVALIAGAVAIGLVTWFVLANLVLIAIGLAVAAVVTVTAVLLLYRHAPLIDWAPQPSRAIRATVPAQAIPNARALRRHLPAIEDGQHLHIHVSDPGAAADLVAAVRGRQS
jgi:hypothetical protein